MSSDSPPSAKRIFSYEEALATFPVVRDLTDTAVRQIESIVNQIKSREEMEDRREELEQAVDHIVERWSEEIMSLGCEVKGMWLIDWDNGDGYYCWKYPEETISHFHTYADGFEGRVPIT